MTDPVLPGTADDGDLRPLCFVLMPFGSKRDAAGSVVDFDAVYQQVIRPAVTGSGLQCVRADEEHVGGIIHKPMFERLLMCDYAVADLSTANANVYYELGVRHAARPWSTVLVFAEGFRLPFDVGPLRGLRYSLDDAGRPARAAGDRDALIGSLRAARSPSTDSPLYQLLDRLSPPDVGVLGAEVFRDRMTAAAQVQARLAEARAQDPAAVSRVRADLGDLHDVDFTLVVELLLSFRAVGAYADMVQLVAEMPDVLSRTAVVREQHGFALNRLGRSQEAEALLTRLIDELGPSSETLGLLGRVYKDRWAAATAAGSDLLARGLLDKAIDAYLRGFEADWRDSYPGLNAVELMSLRDPPDPRREELLPVVRYSARRKVLSGSADYWDHATLAEVAVLEADAEAASAALADALASGPEPWQTLSTLETLRRLREARTRTDAAPAWMSELERQLARSGDTAR